VVRDVWSVWPVQFGVVRYQKTTDDIGENVAVSQQSVIETARTNSAMRADVLISKYCTGILDVLGLLLSFLDNLICS
jgi:hypothetical protein